MIGTSVAFLTTSLAAAMWGDLFRSMARAAGWVGLGSRRDLIRPVLPAAGTEGIDRRQLRTSEPGPPPPLRATRRTNGAQRFQAPVCPSPATPLRPGRTRGAIRSGNTGLVRARAGGARFGRTPMESSVASAT